MSSGVIIPWFCVTPSQRFSDFVWTGGKTWLFLLFPFVSVNWKGAKLFRGCEVNQTDNIPSKLNLGVVFLSHSNVFNSVTTNFIL